MDRKVASQPRQACLMCRKRKMRCDNSRPACSHCSRLGHTCEYPATRLKPGPKVGRVKRASESSASVETAARDAAGRGPETTGASSASDDVSPDSSSLNWFSASARADQMFSADSTTWPSMNAILAEYSATAELAGYTADCKNKIGTDSVEPPSGVCGSVPHIGEPRSVDSPPLMYETRELVYHGPSYGLDPETGEILNNIFFNSINRWMVMIVPSKMLARITLPGAEQSTLALQWVVWALAAMHANETELNNIGPVFYRKARHLLMEIAPHLIGDSLDFRAYWYVELVQCAALCALYEFSNCKYRESLQSTSLACRLAYQSDFHLIDEDRLESLAVPQREPIAVDPLEREERRRAMWTVFLVDRLAAIGSRIPPVLRSRDIRTLLPGDDNAFLSGIIEPSNLAYSEGWHYSADEYSKMGTYTFFMLCMDCIEHTGEFPQCGIQTYIRTFERNGEEMLARAYEMRYLFVSRLPEPHAKIDPLIILARACHSIMLLSVLQAKANFLRRTKPQDTLAIKTEENLLRNESISLTNYLDEAMATQQGGWGACALFLLYSAGVILVGLEHEDPTSDELQRGMYFIKSVLLRHARRHPLARAMKYKLEFMRIGKMDHCMTAPEPPFVIEQLRAAELMLMRRDDRTYAPPGKSPGGRTGGSTSNESIESEHSPFDASFGIDPDRFKLPFDFFSPSDDLMDGGFSKMAGTPGIVVAGQKPKEPSGASGVSVQSTVELGVWDEMFNR